MPKFHPQMALSLWGKWIDDLLRTRNLFYLSDKYLFLVGLFVRNGIGRAVEDGLGTGGV